MDGNIRGIEGVLKMSRYEIPDIYFLYYNLLQRKVHK